jgi:hypothetical protein
MRANKALVALTAAMATAALPVLSGRTDALAAADWVNVAIAMTGAGAVYIAANLEDGGIWTWTKAIMAGLSAALMLVVSQLTGGITGAEVVQVLTAFLGAVAVAMVSNGQDEPTGRHHKPAT